jgi:hypothetical protein
MGVKMTVWECNFMEKGFIDFWDYWSAITETGNMVTAFNDIKRITELPDEEILDNTISAYLYEQWDSDKMVDVKQIKTLVNSTNGLSVSKERFVNRMCLPTLKAVLHGKHFQELRNAIDKVDFSSTKSAKIKHKKTPKGTGVLL